MSIKVSTNAFWRTWPPRQVLVLTRTCGTSRQHPSSDSHHINTSMQTGNCNIMTYDRHQCGPDYNQLTSNCTQLPNDVSHYNIWISYCNLCTCNTLIPPAIMSCKALTFKNTTTIATRTCARCLCTSKSCILPLYDSSTIKTKGLCKQP